MAEDPEAPTIERHRGKAMVMATKDNRIKLIVECDRCRTMEMELHAAHLRSIATTLNDMATRLGLPEENSKVKVVGLEVKPSTVGEARALFENLPVVGIDKMEEVERELKRDTNSAWGEEEKG